MIIKHGEEKKVVRPPVFFPPSPPSPSIPCNTSSASNLPAPPHLCLFLQSNLLIPRLQNLFPSCLKHSLSWINLISERVDNKI